MDRWIDNNTLTSGSKNKLLARLIAFTKRLVTFDYVCVDSKGNKLGTTDDDFEEHRTLAPEDFRASKGGICFDYVNYEYTVLEQFKKRAFLLKFLKNGQLCSSHTFLLIYIHNKVYWLEASWKMNMGLFEFNNENEALSYIVKALAEISDDFDSSKLVQYVPNKKLEGITCWDFVELLSDRKDYFYEEVEDPDMSTWAAIQK